MSMKALKERYDALCALRDATNAKLEPLKVKMEKANAKVIAAQDEANAIAAEINAARGGADWLDLKKEIGALARAVNRGA